ncbi:MAG: hypothetical protein NVS9B14_07640 [Candidatus Acidiferrum sp.]
MRNEHECAAEFEQAFFQNFEGGDIEIVGRLVEEEDLGLHGEGAGDGDALLLAAAQLVGAMPGAMAETNQLQHLGGPHRR